jgi:hypothetical protein
VVLGLGTPSRRRVVVVGRHAQLATAHATAEPEIANFQTEDLHRILTLHREPPVRIRWRPADTLPDVECTSRADVS